MTIKKICAVKVTVNKFENLENSLKQTTYPTNQTSATVGQSLSILHSAGLRTESQYRQKDEIRDE